MTQSAEREVEAWLATLDASGERTLETLAGATIVPTRSDRSARHAADFLAQLAQRGTPVELRTGRVIGEGGMGVVREAEQVALGRIVAVKTLRTGRADAAADLLREAWVTGALEHPNIVPVHHLELDDNLSPLLILKRVDGVEWSVLVRDAAEVQRRFGATDLLAWNLGILGQVMNALRFAHAKGVLHRDLKPSNVMIGHFGEVYLLDWGIAVSLRDDGTGRFPLASDAIDLAGTPCYMAPEMLRRDGDPPLSERTDVYLAGAVLYELITGRLPHTGANALAMISSIVLSKPALPADLPPELAQICARAMHPEPAERYPSIEALQLDLQRYLEHRGSTRLTSGAAEQLDELIALATARDHAQREELYRRLAIVRFAFHEALAVWRDNAEAHDGLLRAAVAVAEYELACGDPRAAVTLLNELPAPHPLLVTAQTAAHAEAQRQRRLEALGRDADPTLNAQTRNIVFVLTLMFVVLPLVIGARPDMGLRDHRLTALFPFACLLTVWALWLWVSRSPMTAINRRVFAAGKLIFIAQTLLAIGCWAMGLTIVHTQTLNMFMWASLCGMFAVHTDPWLGVSSVGYFLAFLFASRYPEWRQFAVSAGNLSLAITVIVRWRPTARAVADRGAR